MNVWDLFLTIEIIWKIELLQNQSPQNFQSKNLPQKMYLKVGKIGNYYCVFVCKLYFKWFQSFHWKKMSKLEKKLVWIILIFRYMDWNLNACFRFPIIWFWWWQRQVFCRLLIDKYSKMLIKNIYKYIFLFRIVIILLKLKIYFTIFRRLWFMHAGVCVCVDVDFVYSEKHVI